MKTAMSYHKKHSTKPLSPSVRLADSPTAGASKQSLLTATAGAGVRSRDRQSGCRFQQQTALKNGDGVRSVHPDGRPPLCAPAPWDRLLQKRTFLQSHPTASRAEPDQAQESNCAPKTERTLRPKTCPSCRYAQAPRRTAADERGSPGLSPIAAKARSLPSPAHPEAACRQP